MKVVEQTLELNSLKFAIKIWGDQKLPKILAFHGWLDNAASFDLLAPLLQSYCVIAVDLCGHGKSDHRPSGVVYYFVDYVKDCYDIANALELDEFILLGHSMGASVAATLAAVIPERVKALILIEGFGPFARTADETVNSLRDSFKEYSKVGNQKKRYAKLELLIKARMQGLWSLPEEAARLLCARGSIQKGDEYSWSSDSRVSRTSIRVSPSQAKNIRENISSPTQIILANDGIAPSLADDAEPLVDFKTAEIHRVEGKHHVHMFPEHVGNVAALVNAFLAKHVS